MKIELVDFQIKPTNRRIATMVVKYYELSMKAELVYTRKEDKSHFAWIRMPEMWRETTKISFCHWEDRNVSNQFQILMLKLIFDKFDLNLDKLSEIHAKAREKRMSSKDFKKPQPKKEPPVVTQRAWKR